MSDLTLGGVIRYTASITNRLLLTSSCVIAARSTATHGSGVRHKNIAGYVTEIEMLTSSGDVVKCSKDEKSEIFYSALCGLGAIG